MNADPLPEHRQAALALDDAVAAWKTIAGGLRPDARERVAALAAAAASEIADAFYERMLADERTQDFLTTDMVNVRLRLSMKRWVARLFAVGDEAQVPAFVAQQVEVGHMHARIKLPLAFMAAGGRVIEAQLADRIDSGFATAEERLAARLYVVRLIHLALDLMGSAYVLDLQKSVRLDEAYRAVALRQDASLERERQRAALSEWARRLLMGLRSTARRDGVEPLAKSEFGLWVKHKAPVFFEGDPNLEIVADAMAQVDEVLVPQLRAPDTPADTIETLLTDLERQIETLRYLFNDLFERLSMIEQGRDAVTQLHNRRFLAPLLAREIDGHAKIGQAFSVLLVRIDSPESAERTDQDLLARQIATILSESVRTGDHLFRYGEAEFLVVAVETHADQAEWIANQIRVRIRGHRFSLRNTERSRATVSIGIAAFDGHPDYRYLLRRVERAMQDAAFSGGDRVVTD